MTTLPYGEIEKREELGRPGLGEVRQVLGGGGGGVYWDLASDDVDEGAGGGTGGTEETGDVTLDVSMDEDETANASVAGCAGGGGGMVGGSLELSAESEVKILTWLENFLTLST